MAFQIKQRKTKYNHKRTKYADRVYDSKFEAKVAYHLDMLVRSGLILKYDTQYRVDMTAYSECKSRSLTISHKVDFRVHHDDGRYSLLEAKGLETQDYKMRARWLKAFWLPCHSDHDYIVIYPGDGGEKWKKLLEKRPT